MTAKIFTGPLGVTFPMLLDPSGGGTLTAVPGKTYDFGDAEPPGPPYWWADVSPSGEILPPADPPAAADPSLASLASEVTQLEDELQAAEAPSTTPKEG